MAHVLDQLRIWIEQVIGSLGYLGLAFVMFLENVFPPIPSEVILPFAGFLVSSGELMFAGVVAAATFGSLVGALLLYGLGRWAGDPIVRAFIRQVGRYLFLTENDLDRALHAFDRHGQAIVFFGRLMPLVRSLISIPAGMDRMPLGKFLLFTALGTAVWSGILTYAGVLLGENWEEVMHYVERYEVTLYAAIVVIGAALLIRKHVLSRRARR